MDQTTTMNQRSVLVAQYEKLALILDPIDEATRELLNLSIEGRKADIRNPMARHAQTRVVDALNAIKATSMSVKKASVATKRAVSELTEETEVEAK